MAWSTSFRPNFWGQFHKDNAHKTQTNNLSNIDDDKLSKWITEYRDAISSESRISLSHKIQKRIHDIGSQVPLFLVPYFRIGYWSYIKFPETPTTKSSGDIGYFGTASGGLIWIDTDFKKQLKKDVRKKIKHKEVTIIDKKWKI